MFTESLESRVLMSANADAAVGSPVAADRLQIHADLLQFRADALSSASTLMTDVSALRADDVKKDTVLAPLFKALRSEVASMHSALKADRMTQASNVLADESVIVGDVQKFHSDAGNADARKADRKAIISDRIKLQNDEIAGLTARLTTRQGEYTKIFNDLTAIATAVQGDSKASDQVKADVQKFVTDRTNRLNTMATDLQKLITDRTKLVSDLTAIQSET